MILTEAVRATGDDLGVPREGLIVKASVWDGPVEVLSCQHVAAILAVIGDPVPPFIVMGGF